MIASTLSAVDEGRNRLATGTLSTQDLTNRSEHDARGLSVSGGFSYGGSGKAGSSEGGGTSSPGSTRAPAQPSGGVALQPFQTGSQGAAAGYVSDSSSRTSTTLSGISGGEIVITDAAAQQERTGQSIEETLASVNREVLSSTGANGLTQRWDGQALQKQVRSGAQIVATFGRQASKAVGDYAQRKREDLKLQAWQAEQAGDVQAATQLREEAARWDEGGAYHVLMHTLTGGLSGGLQGALSSGATAQAAPLIEQITAELPLSEPLQAVAGLVLSSAIGAATGGPGGAAQAFNVDANNRSLHRSERKMAIALAKEFGGRYSVEEIEAQLRQMPNVLLLQSGAAALYIDMQDPKTQQRWIEDRAQDPNLPIAVQGNSIVETQGRAHGELQALIIAATTFKDGPLAGHSPYLMSPQAARDLLSQAASGSPSSSAPRHFDCANTTCLTYGANYNREHPANQAEMQRTADMLKAAGVIISAPALAAVLATPQGMVAVQTLLWNPASAASAAAGVGANAAVQYATTGSVDPKGVVVSGVTGAVGGGAARLLTQGGAMPTVVGHGAALTTVIGTNAAGAAVTGSDQPATALGSVAGYGVGQLPSPYGPPLSALAQELVTWWFSRTPAAPTADKKEAK
ncbi:hypothetical protein [Caldimonas sp.]|uniref:hypothetical protein n=1 Tax=Caldimonas sp. TaxID=2838790 RepID=UPI00391B0A0B